MADDRTYIRVHDGLDEHPKVEPLSDAAFRLLLTCWFYCSRNRTDGRIVVPVWNKRGNAKARRELLTAGLVEDHGDYVEMHDYLEHQRSAQEIRLLQETRGDTGSFGNHVRWHVVRRKPKKDCEHCEADRKSIANGSQMGSQTDRKPIASTEAEAEAEEKNSSKGGSHVSSGPVDNTPPPTISHQVSERTPSNCGPRFDNTEGLRPRGEARVDGPGHLYPDHCKRHGHDPTPGKCGDCADQRKANAINGERLPDYRLRVVPDLCGQCDERWIETPDGLAKCPRCYPQEKSA